MPHNPQSSGRNPFAPLDHPSAPFPIEAWSTSLQNINRAQPPNQLRVSLYTFPDPGLLVSPSNDQKKVQYIEKWLRTRDLWLLRLRMKPSLAMSSQAWRTFFATDLGINVQVNKRAQKFRQEMLDKMLPKLGEEGAGAIQMRNTHGEPMHWQGKAFVPAELPANEVIREILWELYELNFMHEFIWLDRVYMEISSSDSDRLLQRQQLIGACFRGSPLAFPIIPTSNQGLASNNIQDRLPYIRAMSRVIVSWPGAPVFAVEDPDLISDHQASQLEGAVAKFYTQMAFNYLGRAPQIPYHLYPMPK